MPKKRVFLSRVIRAKRKELSQILDIAAPLTVGEIRTRTPVDTGRLKSSTNWRKISELVRRVFNDANYAAAVEFGTASHVITPVRKRALWWEGARHPVKKVRHPGTSAQPFFRPGYRAAAKKIGRLVL